jgi:hypothetical protein
MTLKVRTRSLTPRQREGRALNAVADLLRRRLSVPNIYLEPPSSLVRADVLAVDRAGGGDLHAVEINIQSDLMPVEDERDHTSNPRDVDERYKAWYSKFAKRLESIHRQVMSMPVHFRYLALPAASFDLAFGELTHFGLFPKDGIGRLGIITITERENESPFAELAVVPERFRMDSLRLRAIETKLLDKSRPDIEVRL